MKTADYINALKPLAKRPSIYAVAQLLDLHEDTVRNYARGRRTLDTLAATKIAELLNIPPMVVIADSEAERETDGKRQAFWRELSKKLVGSTVGALSITGLLCAVSLIAPPATASPGTGNSGAKTLYYVKSAIRAWLRGIRRMNQPRAYHYGPVGLPCMP